MSSPAPIHVYSSAIVEAIKTVKSVVVLVSAHTLDSKHVAREVERADSNEKIIIPLLLEDVTASGPLEYYFGATQRVD